MRERPSPISLRSSGYEVYVILNSVAGSLAVKTVIAGMEPYRRRHPRAACASPVDLKGLLEHGMPNYRAYVIGPDGSFARAHNFSAADDSDARTHAERYVDGHDVELWRDDAKLALLLREDVVRRKRG